MMKTESETGAPTFICFKNSAEEALSARRPAPQPEFFTLPQRGSDPFFGLSRSMYYDLEKRGMLALKRLRKPGNVRGRVLVPFQATLALVNSWT
jgi:hypothetical protein